MIFIFNFFLRIYFANQIKGVSGGDAYNNLFIARHIVNGNNPFLEARRLPFYPLLLVPTQFFEVDPILYSRIIAALAGSLLSVVIFLFALSFKLNIFLSIVVAMLTGMSPTLFFVSVRPLSNSTFAFLIVTSVYLFYQNYKKKKFNKNYSLWFMLGLASMTRHEGFVIAFIFFIFLLLKAIKRKQIIKLIYSLIPFGILVLPFFINNYLNFGKLFYSDYLEYPEGLWMPKGWDEFIRNFNMLSEIPKYIWFSGTQFLSYGKILSFILIIGVFAWINDKKKLSIPLIFILLSQVVISFWYQPTIRYWLQIIPFASFLVVYLGFSLSKKYSLKIFVYPLFVLILFFQFKSLYIYMKGTVNQLNQGTRQEYLLRKALLDVSQNFEGKIGLPADYPQALYFLKNKGVYYTTRPPKIDSIEIQEKWIKDNSINYLLIPKEHDFLDIVRIKKFPIVKIFKEDNSEVVMYKVL